MFHSTTITSPHACRRVTPSLRPWKCDSTSAILALPRRISPLCGHLRTASSASGAPNRRSTRVSAFDCFIEQSAINSSQSLKVRQIIEKSTASASYSICLSAAPTFGHARPMPRCPWATSEPNISYHDEEWGVPVHDDRLLFEFLILEGAQAGLSWTTILKKRENYRKAFDGFRPEKIARYGARDVQRLLRDAGIVRNRLKIAATIENAKMFLAVRKEFGTFDAYLWSFVGGTPIQNRWRTMADVPARTAESDAMSRELLRRGFKFVGSTICYALMQATGMVHDHPLTSPRHSQHSGTMARPT